MLLLFELIPEKNDPDKKQIDAAGNCGITFYTAPCSFHFGTPMNIIKNKNGFVIDFSK